MRAHLHRTLFVVLLVTMFATSAMAQQVAASQAAPQPAPQPASQATPQTAPQPASQATPQTAPQPGSQATPQPAARPATAAPAAPAAPAPPVTRLPVLAPLVAQPPAVPTPAPGTLQSPPYAAALRQPGVPVNYRVEVMVTDRLDAKVLGQETFTALTIGGNSTKISRTTPIATAALQLRVSTLPAPNFPPEVVQVTLVAQFKLAKGLADEKDPGVDIGQEISTTVAIGKPATAIDMTSGPAKRRFVVQVTVTRVPVE